MKKLLFIALILFIGASSVSAQVYSITIRNNSSCPASVNISRAIDDTHNGCSGSFNFFSSNFFTVGASATTSFADVSFVNNSPSCPSSAPGWSTIACASASSVSDWAVITVNISGTFMQVFNPNGIGSCMGTGSTATASTGCGSSGNSKVTFSNDKSGNSVIDITDVP